MSWVNSPGGARLRLYEWGDRAASTIVLVHGYPDTHGCWNELATELAERFHVVAYDVRGMGRSIAPPAENAFALEHLAGDLEAVIDAVSPDGKVHLVGHDWGAFQGWEAVTTERIATRIASFTAIAGPRIDRARGWALSRMRPAFAPLRQLLGQARRSWYIAFFQIPAVPERAIGAVFERGWPRAMRRVEGIEPRAGHPASTLVSDARTGVRLYRENLRRLARRPGRGPAQVPVLVVVPTEDAHISTALYDDTADWATQLWRQDLLAGHWAQRSHAPELARLITEFAERIVAPCPPQSSTHSADSGC